MEFASFFFLDEEISLGQIDVHAIHMTYRHLHDPGHPFAPLYLTGKQVLASGGSGKYTRLCWNRWQTSGLVFARKGLDVVLAKILNAAEECDFGVRQTIASQELEMR